MRRRIVLPLVAAASWVGLHGCGISAVGLAPLSPQAATKAFSPFIAFSPVSSLTPTLHREALAPRALDAAGGVSDVTYELRVWKTVSGYSGDLVYVRDGLLDPFHQLADPLQPGTKYLWTVRAHFTLDGRRWVTEWGMAGNPLRDQVVPNASCFRFETPPLSQ
jgi:hypothetical protein